MKRTCWLLIITTFMLAACSAESVPPAASTAVLPITTPSSTATPTPAVVATATVEPATTAVSPATAAPPAPTAAPTAVPDYTNSAGQTEEGAFFRGNPDAPVVLNDYSDFL